MNKNENDTDEDNEDIDEYLAEDIDEDIDNSDNIFTAKNIITHENSKNNKNSKISENSDDSENIYDSDDSNEYIENDIDKKTNKFTYIWDNFVSEIITMNNYVNFINITADNINNLILIDKNIQLENCKKFNDYLQDDNYFNLFLKKKTKVFSHKDNKTKELSGILFNNIISTRDLLTNQTNKVKNIIWKHLYDIFIFIEKNKLSPDLDKIKLLENAEPLNKTKINKKLDELLENNLEDGSKDIIKDIVSSFDNIALDTNHENIINNILNISKNISDKYSDDINSNKIDMKHLLANIVSKTPGAKEALPELLEKLSEQPNQINVDEQFSTSSVNVSKNNKDINDIISDINIGKLLKSFK
jgi:hypothetical protein